MPWTIGADVVVRTLGHKRGTVLDIDRQGRYRVRVEGATMWCREEDLAEASSCRARADRAASDATRTPAVATADSRPVVTVSLDLHGLTVEESTARVLAEIDRALQAGSGRMEIIHGKGSGRIRSALHRLLKALPVVVSFELDPRNPGVTWVYF
jgi:DNA mismatch repair protein MutS2